MKGVITKSLCKIRKEQGITQRDLAKIADITTNYYQMIEYGTRVPTVYIAIKIAKALGVTVEELFSE